MTFAREQLEQECCQLRQQLSLARAQAAETEAVEAETKPLLEQLMMQVRHGVYLATQVMCDGGRIRCRCRPVLQSWVPRA